MSDPNETPAREPALGAGDRVRAVREHLEQARAALNTLDQLLPAAPGLNDADRGGRGATDSASGDPGP